MADSPPHVAIDVAPTDTIISHSEPSKLNPLPRPGSSRKNTTDNKEFQSSTEPWLSGAPHKYAVPKKGDPWEKCYKKMKEYDKDLCEGWRDEIDKLLIFAGLFSAAVTAFVIESYQSLQEDPNERNTWLLEQILIQVHNANTGNTSPSVPLPSPPTFSPSGVDVRVNTFWFMGLSLSLTTVFLGILCIQWLRVYDRDAPLDPQDAICLRQLRYEGLKAWKVPQVLLALPLLLHLALILFFVGLIDLLWSLNRVVAFFVSILSGIVLLFLVVTTILPTFQLYFLGDNHLRTPQCAYKSPQSWAFHRLFTYVIRLIRPPDTLFHPSFITKRFKLFYSKKDWVDYDNCWRESRNPPNSADYEKSDTVRALAWVDKHLGQSIDMAFAVYHCLRDLPPIAAAHVLALNSEQIRGYLFPNTEPKGVLGSMAEDDSRETVVSLFLEANSRAFPQLGQYQIESTIRVLNSRMAESPTTRNGKEIADSLPFLRWPLHLRGMPTDLVSQFLLCLKELVSQNQLRQEYVEDVWLLIQLILSTSSGRNKKMHTHVDIVWGIMGEFVKRLPDVKGVPPGDHSTEDMVLLKDEVKNCAKNIIRSFPLRHLQDLSTVGQSILLDIHTRMKALGGPAAVLSPVDETRWSEIMGGAGS